MRLNEELLELCEEFFDYIVNDEENVHLDSAMDSLRRFLEEDIDGWTDHDNETLALAVESRLEEIWDLISPEEQKNNAPLSDYYEEILYKLDGFSQRDLNLEAGEFETDEDCGDESNHEEESCNSDFDEAEDD